MAKTWKSLISLLLVLVFVFQLIPVSILATNANEDVSETEATSEVDSETVRNEHGKIDDSKEAYIVGEVKDFRDESVKHFRMSDGTIEAVQYSVPVHYQDLNGEWKNIDNTLLKSGSSYYSVNGKVTKAFPETLSSGKLFDIAYDKYQLSMSLLTKKGSFTDGDDLEPSFGESESTLSNSSSINNKLTDEESEETLVTPNEAADEISNSGSGSETDLETDNTQYDANALEPQGKPDDSNNADTLSFINENNSFTISSGYQVYNDPAVKAEINNPKNIEKKAGEFSNEEMIALDEQVSKVTYANADNNIDFVYTNYGYNIKESIVIHDRQTSYMYSFFLNLVDLNPVIKEDGSVEFTNDSGETIFIIPAPFMYDANGAFSHEAKYILSKTDESYVLTVSADSSWISSEDRAFPVTLDPSVIVAYGVSNYNVKTFLLKPAGSTNNGISGADQYFGCYEGSVSEIAYQITALPSIPKNGVIVNAQVGLANVGLFTSGFQNTSSGFVTAEAHRVTGLPDGYCSSLSYNDVHGNSNVVVNEKTLDFKKLDSSTVSSINSPPHLFWDVTSAAQHWYDSGNNSGWLLFESPDCYEQQRFVNIMGHYVGVPSPMFIIQYRSIVGLESYYPYEQMNAGRAGDVYLSNFTNELVISHPDVSLELANTSLTISHYYNSAQCGSYFSANSYDGIHTKSFTNMILGAGWKLSIQQTVVEQDIGNVHYLIYTDEDGTEHYFRSHNAGEYCDEDGIGLTITIEGSGTSKTYTMTDKDVHNTWKFYNGYLISQTDDHGNAYYFAYNGYAYSENGSAWKPTASSTNRITQVVQHSNTGINLVMATLQYDPTTNHLTSITDYANRVTYFSYSGTKLIKITEPDTKEMFFTYDESNSNLTAAFDGEAQYGLEFTHRVSLISGHLSRQIDTVREFSAENINAARHYGNGFRPFRHNPQLTSIRYYGADHVHETDDDLVVFNALDYYGRIITSYTTNGPKTELLGVSAGAYKPNSETEPASNNRLSKTASSGKHVENLIMDSSIELSANGNWAGWSTNCSAPYTGAVAVASNAFRQNNITIYPHTGQKALRLTLSSTSANAYCGLRQKVSLEGGKSYTFSAYVNTSIITSFGANTSSSGVFLRITDNSGNEKAKSEVIRYKTNPEINNGWERISVTYTPASNTELWFEARQNAATGYSFFDDFQLEISDTLSHVNLIQNSSFDRSGTTCWSMCNDSVLATTSNTAPDNLKRGCAIRITGNHYNDRHVTQTVAVNLSPDSTFLLSAWGKGDSIFFFEKDDETDYEHFFGLIATAHYSDGYDETFYFPFSPAYNDWQYTSGVIAPKPDHEFAEGVKLSSIEVALAFDNNANNAYFDEISLIQEPAQTFLYDSRGNTYAANDAEAKSSYEYYEGTSRISKYTSPANLEYTLNYSDTLKNDVTDITMGGLTDYTYYDPDTKNPITFMTRVGYSGIYLKSSNAYTEHGEFLWKHENQNGIETEYTYNPQKQLDAVTNEAGTEQQYAYYTNSNRYEQTFIHSVASVWYGYDKGYLNTMRRKKYSGVSGCANQVWQKYTLPRDMFGNTQSIEVSASTTTDEDEYYSDPIVLASYDYENGVNNGRLHTMTHANGDTVNYTYDLFDRVIQETYNDGKTYIIRYNSEGNTSEKIESDAQGGINTKYSYDYDSLGRLIHSKQLDGNNALVQRTEHQYDPANRITKQGRMYPDNSAFSQSYTYSDTNGTLSKMNYHAKIGSSSSIFSPEVNYSYNSLRQLSSKTTTGLFSKNYSYKTLGSSRSTFLVSQLSYNLANSGEAAHEEFDYYDQLGNISQTRVTYEIDNEPEIRSSLLERALRLINPPAYGERVTNYQYDVLGQLTKVSLQDESGTSRVFQYDYDSAGNLRSANEGNSGWNGQTIVDVGRTYTYGNTSWPDLLTGITVQYNNHTGSATIQYPTDQGGNVTAGTPLTWYNGSHYNFTWTHGTQLNSVTVASGGYRVGAVSVNYSYDLAGIRRSKTVNNVEYQFATLNGKICRQSWGNKCLDFLYDESDQPYAVIYTVGNSTPEIYYYILNVQGDVVGIMDASGEVVAKYYYDAWGAPLDEFGESIVEVETDSVIGNINPLRYRGYYYDAETGLYYLQSRYYDPFIGRFINSDIFAASDVDSILSCNMFAYCENDPANRSDPYGLFTIAIGFVATAAWMDGLGICGQIIVDDNWNVGILISGYGIVGTPNVSAGLVATYTNADTIYDLNGTGYFAGGSCMGVGLDVGYGRSPLTNEEITALSVSWLPVSSDMFLAELHVGVSPTKVHPLSGNKTAATANKQNRSNITGAGSPTVVFIPGKGKVIM